MEETMVKRGNRLIVYVPRELDHHFAEQITEELDSELEKGTVRQLVFDFSATTFMDSSGIGMLMGRKRLLSCCGGTVSAIHVSDRIWRIMQLLEFTNTWKSVRKRCGTAKCDRRGEK